MHGVILHTMLHKPNDHKKYAKMVRGGPNYKTQSPQLFPFGIRDGLSPMQSN